MYRSSLAERISVCERWTLRLFEDLHNAPALGGRQRAGLHDEDEIADAALVVLVVNLDLLVLAHDLAVEGVLDAVLDLDDNGLVHLVADDVAATDLTLVTSGGFCHQAHSSVLGAVR